MTVFVKRSTKRCGSRAVHKTMYVLAMPCYIPRVVNLRRLSTHPAKLGAALDDRRGSTIDVDGDTREIAGPFRGQEGYHVASLVGFADPAQRNVAGFRSLDVKLVKA